MTDRIANTLQDAEHKALSVFTTAGFPRRQDTLTVLRTLQDAGVNMIELGFPFSDPLADGPTIQQANTVALAQGMSLKVLFEQLQELRPAIHIPVLLMGYLNPVLQFGPEAFFQRCQEVGIDGLILPDLPLPEYLEHFKPLYTQYGLKSVFLITPQTSPQRIRLLDEATDGFLYVVSSHAVTGTQLDVDQHRQDYFARIAAMKLKNPLVVGFGIHDRASFAQSTAAFHGGIIGSAFLKAIRDASPETLPQTIQSFIQTILPG